MTRVDPATSRREARQRSAASARVRPAALLGLGLGGDPEVRHPEGGELDGDRVAPDARLARRPEDAAVAARRPGAAEAVADPVAEAVGGPPALDPGRGHQHRLSATIRASRR
jgi:hypothetical protein